jgi:hypothetical protein
MAAVMRRRVPLWLRYHAWRRGGHPTVLVYCRYPAWGPMVSFNDGTLEVWIDGEPAGSHVSPLRRRYRGTMGWRIADPMFEPVAPGLHVVQITGLFEKVVRFECQVFLAPGDTLLIWGRPERKMLGRTLPRWFDRRLIHGREDRR